MDCLWNDRTGFARLNGCAPARLKTNGHTTSNRTTTSNTEHTAKRHRMVLGTLIQSEQRKKPSNRNLSFRLPSDRKMINGRIVLAFMAIATGVFVAFRGLRTEGEQMVRLEKLLHD